MTPDYGIIMVCVGLRQSMLLLEHRIDYYILMQSGIEPVGSVAADIESQLDVFSGDVLKHFKRGFMSRSHPLEYIKNNVIFSGVVFRVPVGIIYDFVESVSCKLDSFAVVEISGEDKFKNDKILAPFVDGVLDFLALYGYQEEWFVGMDTSHRFIMNCIIKYHMTSFGSVKLKRYMIDGVDIDMNPRYMNHNYSVSPYNMNFYLGEITRNASSDVTTGECFPMLSADAASMAYMDSILSALSNESLDGRMCYNAIVSIIKDIGPNNILRVCSLKLANLLKASIIIEGVMPALHNYLLNCCVAFVFAKPLGVVGINVFNDPNQTLVIFSFVLRYILTYRKKDQFNRWIVELINYYKLRTEDKSMWKLFA